MRNCSLTVSTVGVLLTVAQIGLAGQGPLIETQVEVRVHKVPAPTRYEFSRTVRPGGIVKASDGKDGAILKSYRVTYKDHEPVGLEFIKEEKREAVPTLYLVNRSGYPTSRGGFGRGRILSMVATGYSAMVTGTGRTKMGMRAGYGHAAVDPRVIPLGTLLYVEGYGMAIASDIGGAIKGNRIDLCFPNTGAALQYGHRPLKVHVLGRR